MDKGPNCEYSPEYSKAHVNVSEVNYIIYTHLLPSSVHPVVASRRQGITSGGI